MVNSIKHLKKTRKQLVLTNGSSLIVETINFQQSLTKLSLDPNNNKFWKEGSLQTIDDSNKRILKFTNKYKK